MSKIFVGQIINPRAIDRIDVMKMGICIVSKEGRIEVFNRTTADEVTILRDRLDPDAEWIQLGPDQFLIPGFIDCHMHPALFGVRGMGSECENLMEWHCKILCDRERWFNLRPAPEVTTNSGENSMAETNEAYYRRVTEHYSSMVRHLLKCGTTTCAYVGSLQVEANVALVDVLKKCGQRAIIGKGCLDAGDMAASGGYGESFEDSFNNTLLFVDAVGEVDGGTGMLSAALTPNFAHGCSAELLRDLGTIARDAGIPVQVHFAASKGEMTRVRQKFPHFASYSDVFDQSGLLTPKTILAHAVHLTAEDRQLIRHRGAGIAHCPAADLNLLNGVCDVQSLLADGIKVGLGTDCSAGPDTSLLDVIRRCVDTSKIVSLWDPSKRTLAPAEAFYLATMGGARLLGVDGLVGNFEVGKCMDAMIVDVGVEGTPITLLPDDDLIRKFERFLLCGDDRNIHSVWVNGRKVDTED